MMNKKLTMGILTVMLACAFMIAAVPAVDVDGGAATDNTYEVTYVVGDTYYNKTVKFTETSPKYTLLTPAELGATVAANKVFKGWYKNDVLMSEPLTATDFSQVGATNEYVCKLTAIFGPAEFDVTFVANSIATVTTTYGYDAPVTAPVNYVVPAGFVFAGWSNGTETLTSIPNATADATYTAVFEKVKFTVTYKLDGAVYSTQKVLAVADAVAPYIVGYTWGEAATVGYQTVIDAIPVPPAPTVTVKYFKGTEVYSVQVVPAAVNAIDPYVAGYTWGEKVKVDDANYTVTAIAIPRTADNSFGIDNFTLAVIVIVLIAVIGIVLYVAYEQGFLPVGKNKIAGDAKR